ncbi:hypothetical protein M9H77_31881 [Catharanthus roseus]|uniref:Uncharacterized protein n=1 Tax=Catharanthus roseus TaxID=4058 RepID=A0ACC0A277_CATRO|nr:hypothetical protein M9H77_31881 [Catharanthus roseus]
MTSKFISKLISHLVANDLKIPVSNAIQEVQVLLQIGCTYKRGWHTQKFSVEKVFDSWETTFSILPKNLQAMKDSNSELDPRVTLYNPREGIYMVKSPIRLDDSGINVYTLKINEKSCSCDKFYKDNGTRPDAYVSDVY